MGHVSVGYGPMAVRACATFSPFVLWGYKAETLALYVVHYSVITSYVETVVTDARSLSG